MTTIKTQKITYTPTLRKARIGSRLNQTPVAPTLLIATSYDDVRIDLEWTINATGQDGHRIYISTDNITFTEKATVFGETAIYSATGLTEGTQYYFYVVAYKGSRESDNSNTVSISTYTYTLLHEKVFTDSEGWTLSSVSGAISAIDSLDGEAKLHIKYLYGVGKYAVAYKTGIFTVGDILRVTLSGVNNVGTQPCILRMNNGLYGASVIRLIESSGTVVFDNIDTTTSSGDYFIISDNDGTDNEIFIKSIKIEKKNQLIENEVFDSVLNNSIIISEEPGYDIRNPFSEFEFYTTDELIKMKAISTIYPSYPSYASIAVFEDDVYKSIHLVEDVNYIDVPLSAGNKKVTLVEGLTSTAGTSVMRGTFLTSVLADNFSKNNHGTVETKTVFLVDSIGVGGNADNAQKEAFTRLFKIENSKEVSVLGYGYGKLKDFAETTPKITDTVNKLVALLANATEKKIAIALGTNDYGLDSTAAVTFGTWYANLVDAINTADSGIEIYCISPIRRSGDPALLADYRTEINTICSTRVFATHINGYDILLLTDMADGVHPTTAGHKKYKDAIYPVIYPA